MHLPSELNKQISPAQEQRNFFNRATAPDSRHQRQPCPSRVCRNPVSSLRNSALPDTGLYLRHLQVTLLAVSANSAEFMGSGFMSRPSIERLTPEFLRENY